MGSNRRIIVVSEFQKILLKRYGSFQTAWSEAFDKEYCGFINFAKFSVGCKHAGYSGNISRLWPMLDDDHSGEITIDEIAMNVGEVEKPMMSITSSPQQTRSLVAP